MVGRAMIGRCPDDPNMFVHFLNRWATIQILIDTRQGKHVIMVWPEEDISPPGSPSKIRSGPDYDFVRQLGEGASGERSLFTRRFPPGSQDPRLLQVRCGWQFGIHERLPRIPP